MRVLYIGVYRDATGWAESALRYILALDAAGVEVVARPVRLNNARHPIPERVRELEGRTSRGCDVVVQHVLPHMLDYNGRFELNAALYFSETDSIAHSAWNDRLNVMDLAIGCNRQMEEAARASHVTVPYAVVPIPADLSLYRRTWEPLEQIRRLKDEGHFVFYTLGEMVRRKNLQGLLKAFHTEFAPEEPVSLVIKTSRPGLPPHETMKHMVAFCNEIKRGLKLYGGGSAEHYKQEVIITDRLTQEEVFGLHAACDCFVQPSYGEAWCALPGTSVDTTFGPKRVEAIVVGDEVFTHLGRTRPVIQTLARPYRGEVVLIKPHGLKEELAFTPEHRHYIVKRRRVKYFRDIPILPVFEEAGSIEPGDFWVVPKLTVEGEEVADLSLTGLLGLETDTDGQVLCKHSCGPSAQESLCQIAARFGCSHQFVGKVLNGQAGKRPLARAIKAYADANGIVARGELRLRDKIHLTPDFMFFLGHYLAEGWSEESKTTLATHKMESWGRHISSLAVFHAFGLSTTETPTSANGVNLSFNNAVVGRLLRLLCGQGADGKFIHPLLKRSRNLDCLIRGYFYGDGCFSKGKLSVFTVSERLARDFVEICNKLGVFVTQSHEIREDGQEGYSLRVVAQHTAQFFKAVRPVKYDLELTCPEFRGQAFLMEDERAFYLPVQSVRRCDYEGPVYNFSVADDESYTVRGYATHNCIPAFDAMALGKTPIVTDWSGYRDYVSPDTGWLVPAMREQVFGIEEGFIDLYTGKESWAAADHMALRRAMREAYEDEGLRSRKAAAGTQRANDFSYESIGRLLREVLENERGKRQRSGPRGVGGGTPPHRQ